MGRCRKCGGPLLASWRVGSLDDEPATCLHCGEPEYHVRPPTAQEMAMADEESAVPVGRAFVGDRSVYARRRGTVRRERRSRRLRETAVA